MMSLNSLPTPQPVMFSMICLVLGLAFLCGLNLYLTTFLVSAAVQFGWIDAALHPALAWAGHPAVFFLALGMAVLEFFIDKVPWVDSGWDALHTLIRPPGAALFAYMAMTQSGAGVGVSLCVTALALGVALSTHLTKSGVRLLVNASPEPFSNILTSLAVDAMVLVLVLLLINAPVTGAAVCLALLVWVWIVLPRLFRLVIASAWLLWKRFLSPAKSTTGWQKKTPLFLSLDQENRLRSIAGDGDVKIEWALPCITGRIRGGQGLRSNRFGWLIALSGQPAALFFLPRGWFGLQAARISLAGASVRTELSFLSSNLVIRRQDAESLPVVFRFPRGDADLVSHLTLDLRQKLGLAAPVDPLPLDRFPESSSQPADAWVRSSPAS